MDKKELEKEWKNPMALFSPKFDEMVRELDENKHKKLFRERLIIALASNPNVCNIQKWNSPTTVEAYEEAKLVIMLADVITGELENGN